MAPEKTENEKINILLEEINKTLKKYCNYIDTHYDENDYMFDYVGGFKGKPYHFFIDENIMINELYEKCDKNPRKFLLHFLDYLHENFDVTVIKGYEISYSQDDFTKRLQKGGGSIYI